MEHLRNSLKMWQHAPLPAAENGMWPLGKKIVFGRHVDSAAAFAWRRLNCRKENKPIISANRAKPGVQAES
jgi:hypothetical protein